MENTNRVVAADLKTHPFFNTLDVHASTTISEYEVDFYLAEYCVKHSFWGNNRGLRSPQYLKQLFSGIKAPRYRSFHIDVDFIGQMTQRGEKCHRVEAKIKNQTGIIFPLIEEFSYEGTTTADLAMLPGQAGHKKYINMRATILPLSSEIGADAGLFQLEEILKITREKYPGKDPLEKGKVFLSEFYSAGFKFYPQ